MKRILSAIILFLATITLMAQNSFVVVDKNGNSKFVQDLIFQQQNGAFSWGSTLDGYRQDQDIKDLLFIARANSTLTTGTAEEVTQMLEDLSGTDKADAEAVAEALKGNSNVVDAYSADGNNLIVKKDNDSYVIYPMYEMKAPFSELPQLTSRESSVRKVPSPRRVLENSDKIAIFNFFDGMSGYEVQNTIVSSFITELAFAGYTAECYGHPAISGRDFSYANLNYVLEHSEDYAAIAIFSHGAKLDDGTSCFCTRELAGDNDSRIRNDADKKYYKSYSASIQTNNDCILYLGICDGLNEDNFNSTSPVIGYSGKTCMAQANYCMLLYLMLVEGYTLENAINALPKEPAPNQETKIYRSNKVNGRDLTLDCNSRITNYFHSVSLEYNLINNRKMGYILAGKYEGTLPHKGWGSAEFIPITGDYNWWQSYVKYRDVFLKKHFFVNEEKKFSIRLGFLEDMPEGVFICRIYGYENEVADDGLRNIKLVKPRIYRFLVNSKNFKENSADEVLAEEDFYTPSILDASGQTISEISVPVGNSQTFAITGYSGHTFNVVTLNTEVVDVSVSGTTLTVKGLKADKTYLGVYDEQNKQMAIAEVTVTAGGDTPGPGEDVTSYTACPDANHPHWIDLGIGTLWRCCNEGASTPEEDGGYYTFDQAQAYNPPSSDQIEALVNNCSYTWTTQNGVKGGKFTGPNGGTIFLPAAGYVWDGKLDYFGTFGRYRSSTSRGENGAYYLNFNAGYVGTSNVNDRYGGLSVRPVLKNSSLTLSVSTSSLSITKGETSTVDITSGSGEYGVTNLNGNIAKATLDGTTITVNAIAAGDAKIVVTDIQTKQEIIIKITVTAKSIGDTPGPGGDVTAYTACPDANHPHWIDLGIGILWRCCNVGASTPEEYGSYYTFDQAQAYNPPSNDQIEALVNNCSYTRTTQNGVNGWKFTSKVNGGTIFLPAAGFWDGELCYVGLDCLYWSSSPIDEDNANGLDFISRDVGPDYPFYHYGGRISRSLGRSVRPVLKNPSLTLSVSVSSLSMTEGEASIVYITSGSGEYGVTNLNSNIAKATLGGTRITVHAIAAGEAKIVVTDTQTKQEIIIKITVTAKSSGNTPAGLQAVDLGLPSGTLWANMNVGAETPEDYGLYFAWGETTGYTGDTSDGRSFGWTSYKWCNGSETTLTKYCTNSDYGTVDNKPVLEAEDDAAHVNWGGSWRMPTLADFQELRDNTTNEWTTQNGVNGRKFTSKTNGNSIFLPAAGDRCDSGLHDVGFDGRYWSSSLLENVPCYAHYLYFSSRHASWSNVLSRGYGHSVRPVTNK